MRLCDRCKTEQNSTCRLTEVRLALREVMENRAEAALGMFEVQLELCPRCKDALAKHTLPDTIREFKEPVRQAARAG
jgi:hypothetical protein